MQKFGAQTQESKPLSGLELEIAQEQAESLGLAGKKLEQAIVAFERFQQRGSPVHDRARLIDEISQRAWALIVQRELIGFKHDNLRWVLANFDLPDAAISRLGKPDPIADQ